MSLALRLIAALFGGFALHRAYGPTQALGERWGSMAREAVGVAGMTPFLLLIHHATQTENEDERLMIAYFLTALFFGSGVVAGHLVDKAMGD